MVEINRQKKLSSTTPSSIPFAKLLEEPGDIWCQEWDGESEENVSSSKAHWSAVSEAVSASSDGSCRGGSNLGVSRVIGGG